jgi:hypothetical protein
VQALMMNSEDQALVNRADSVRSRLANDSSLIYYVNMVSGMQGCSMISYQTMTRIETLWHQLDHTNDGKLMRNDFETGVGTHRIWKDLLINCDLNGDGIIEFNEFFGGLMHIAMVRDEPVNINGARNVLKVLELCAARMDKHVNGLLDSLEAEANRPK